MQLVSCTYGTVCSQRLRQQPTNTTTHNQQARNSTQDEHTTSEYHACSEWLVVSSSGSDCATIRKPETWHNAVRWKAWLFRFSPWLSASLRLQQQRLLNCDKLHSVHTQASQVSMQDAAGRLHCSRPSTTILRHLHKCQSVMMSNCSDILSSTLSTDLAMIWPYESNASTARHLHSILSKSPTTHT